MKCGRRLAGLTLALAMVTVPLAGCRFEDERGTKPAETVVRTGAIPLAAAGAVPVQKGFRERYIKGSGGFFQPEKICTRAEIAQILCNLGISSPGDRQFSDVDPSAWYGPAVTQLAGVLRGYSDGTMRPMQNINLAELLTILCRGLDVETPKADAGEAWYEPVVSAARERGWLEGLNQFVPTKGADRATVVFICNRAMGRTPDHAAIDRLEGQVFLDLPKGHFAYYDILEAALDHSEDWKEVERSTLKPGLHVMNGTAYFVKENGTVDETPGIREKDGISCLISENHGRVYADGAVHMVDGSPVFCTEEGTLLKNGEWHGFHFDANGRYTSGDAELDRYVETILRDGTKENMSQEEKLYACNCRIRDFSYLGRNEAYPDTVKTIPHADAVDFAKKIFATGKGDCYNFAAAYYFCAKRLGLDAAAVVGRCSYVRWGTSPYPHAWLEIPMDGKTYIFDAQIENNNIRNGVSNEEFGVFKSSYETAPAVYIKN